MSISKKQIGIIAYGTYLPLHMISAQAIAEANGLDAPPALGVVQKTVVEPDEDTATMSVASAQQALSRLPNPLLKQKIGALWIGSESHPYAVKPTGTMVAAALGLPKKLSLADLQFACKAGTQGLQIALAYVQSGLVEVAMSIGADTAQSRPGDVLEYTAGAGGAAYLLGTENILCELLGTTSYATDTPDFWRRPGQEYPEHAGRFTGEPAYFYHIEHAVNNMLEELKMDISEFDHCVFHTPNGKFPVSIAKKLGAKKEQMQWSLPVKKIGNTYAAATMLAFANVLDHAEAGQKILVASYGSGAGSDVFVWQTTEQLVQARAHWNNFLAESIERLTPITYSEYRSRGGHL